MINRFTIEVERFLCYEDMDPLGCDEICCHDMCCDLDTQYIDVTISNVRYTPAIPGRLSGPPENCYPDEPEEYEYEYDPPVKLTGAEEANVEDEIRDRFFESNV